MGPSKKYFIINADDAGFSAATGAALLEAAGKGTLTSCSVAVGARQAASFAERLELMSNPPDVGLHLNLTEGAPVAAAREVDSLLGPDGRFLGLKRFFLRRAAGRIQTIQIKREIEAQFALAAELGLKLTHIDGHHHVHLFQGVAAHAAAAADRAGVAWFRPSSAPAHTLDLKTVHFNAFDLLARNTAEIYRKRGLRAPGAVFRVAAGNESFTGHVFKFLSDTKHSVVELLCHPGVRDPAFPLPDDVMRNREIELDFIINLDSVRLLDETGFTLARRKDIFW